jgi:N-acetylglucosamine-6-sulfatase
MKDVAAAGALTALWGWRAPPLDATAGTPRTGPNLILVYPDQMRGQAMGFLGEEPVRTPRLDAFARQSAVLPQAVVNYPVCSPSRAMLLTGRYPHASGVLGNCNSRTEPYGYELPRDIRCWSDVLHDHGYSLGYIGKWHLDSPRPPYVESPNNTEEMAWNEWTSPSRRHGFDFWHAYGTMDRHTTPMYWDTEAPRDGAVRYQEWGPIHEADLAIRYIQDTDGEHREPGAPFALVVSMNPPHMPYDLVPDEYVQRYADLSLEELTQRPNIPPAGTRWGDYYREHIRDYYGMLTGVDEQFGRILDALEQAGLQDDTIVVFSSDHGNCLGIHDEISKSNAYAESMRVPLLVRWPGRIEARRHDVLFSTPDFLPTLLELMDLGEDIPAGVQGASHARLLTEGTGPGPSSQLFVKPPVGQSDWGVRGVRTHTHTLVVDLMPGEPPSFTLFHDAEDPFQMDDVADARPDVVNALIADELIPWLERTEDPWLGRWRATRAGEGGPPG